ncbi:Sulfotransferase family protein [Virgibacillus subterraneus]|uniref:Sulfotransferase family protein n=1 Tax=Virgibacillus subterraneus TaxID=621109 RepID=A0A1H9AK56_9BACI|nr:sulfotransferase [Virgibacillus subterraneus]SEP76348.1 Sulfotransferase family protein [Virgibacillus subterraneus]
MNQEPIFIMGAHKSGTSLLRNLFDGHSELFVIPIEAHFFKHNGYWIDYGIRRKFPNTISESEIIENYMNWIKYVNTLSDQYADSDTKGFWSFEKFTEEIRRYSDYMSLKTSIENYIHAMYHSLTSKKLANNLRVIEKSVENAEFANILKKIYPNAKFIHIIRNPYSNIVSIRKFKSKNGYPNLRPIIQSLYNNYYYLEKNQVTLDKDYLVVKYEDLVMKPEQKIKQIVEFTGISDEEITYVPTVKGENWEGNSTTNVKFKGLSSEGLSRWTSEIEPTEVNLVNKLFKYTLNRYGYRTIENKSMLKFARGENPKTYIANRILFKYL